MCRALEIHPSGFYAWLKQPEYSRAQEDKRLLGQIKQFWIESGFVYGYRNITLDLKSGGESCGKNRVYRIMKGAGIRSLNGYKRHRGFKSGDLSRVAPNILNRQFEVEGPNQAWVTDFTYIRTMRAGSTLRLYLICSLVKWWAGV